MGIVRSHSGRLSPASGSRCAGMVAVRVASDETGWTFLIASAAQMNAPLDSSCRTELLSVARAAAQHSYSPYSRFRVGAAVLTSSGIFSGANVENASYGLALCAERSALSAAISAGATTIEAIAVSCIDARVDISAAELMPCGACRQWIVELAPDAVIIVDGVNETFTSRELLPKAFALQPRQA